MKPAEREVSEIVGERLKKLYNSVASESVPDRFADLLNKLSESEKSRNG